MATVVEREAFRVVVGGSGAFPLVLTCEHASERLPSGWSWPDDDRWLLGTHWAFDLGAEELTRHLAATLGAPAVLSRFSRLLVDPNRPLDEPSLFLDRAEGLPVALNLDLSEADRARRIDEAWTPFHEACDAVVARARGADVLSIHTFTPVYERRARAVEVGVLFDAPETAWAVAVRDAVAALGLDARLNEPYSGAQGLMYSPHRHASAHRRRPLELEVRQDLAVDPSFRELLVPALAAVLRDTVPST